MLEVKGLVSTLRTSYTGKVFENVKEEEKFDEGREEGEINKDHTRRKNKIKKHQNHHHHHQEAAASIASEEEKNPISFSAPQVKLLKHIPELHKSMVVLWQC